MSKIQEALRHVKSMHPDVTQVTYDKLGWAYSAADGSYPEFDIKKIDLDLLCDAQGEADSHPGQEPKTYYLEPA